MIDGREFYTVRELAAILRLSTRTIYELAKRGDIPCHTIGHAKRFRRQDVEDFLYRCVTGRTWSWMKGG